MKLRIKSNSIRYRLTKTDVSDLYEKGFICYGVKFPGNSFDYAIKLTHDDQLSAIFDNCTVTLFMPDFMVKEFIDTDRVGFDWYDGGVQLLVEKDFTCLDNVAEDQSDNYPNPLAKKIL